MEYMLEYMRDGKVMIPYDSLVTKEALLTEFKKQGFDNMNCNLSNAIHVALFPELQSTVVSVVDSIQRVHSLEQDYEARLQDMDQEIEDMHYKRQCMALAFYLFREYKKTNSFQSRVSEEDIGQDLFTCMGFLFLKLRMLDITKTTNYNRPASLERFHHACLAHFGLQYKNVDDKHVDVLGTGSVMITLEKYVQ